MRILLDTHTFLWFIAGSEQISQVARNLIEDPNNEAFLSIASLWEIAIKVGLGKLTLGARFEQLIPQQLQDNDIKILAIELPHLNRLMTLPMHHRDPFDRLIIAQTAEEGLALVGTDTIFDRYQIIRLW